MVNKNDHQIKMGHLKKVMGNQVRLESPAATPYGISLGIKNPEPECIMQDNRWFYGDIALINKKHSPKFSLYNEPYFPAVVVGSYKGKLVLVGKCSDDTTETYTGELLTVPTSVAIHVINFCIGHGHPYSFFGNPDGLQHMVALRACSGSPVFDVRSGDMCTIPVKSSRGTRTVNSMGILVIAFVKTHEWKVVGVVMPFVRMQNWSPEALECHIGQAGAVTFLEKFRTEENGYVVWHSPENRGVYGQAIAKITEIGKAIVYKHARSGSDTLKSIVQVTASSTKLQNQVENYIVAKFQQ